MSFEREKKRMFRILKACGAPKEVIDDFDSVCGFHDKDSATTAEELLLDVCRRHNFTAPWGNATEFYPAVERFEESEQSYRRGYHHGMKRVIDDLTNGMSMADIKALAARIDTWRREEPVQEKFAPLGWVRPTGLPPEWDNV